MKNSKRNQTRLAAREQTRRNGPPALSKYAAKLRPQERPTQTHGKAKGLERREPAQ
jgi:hypothetical protein